LYRLSFIRYMTSRMVPGHRKRLNVVVISAKASYHTHTLVQSTTCECLAAEKRQGKTLQ
jgi:hypothetical protein